MPMLGYVPRERKHLAVKNREGLEAIANLAFPRVIRKL